MADLILVESNSELDGINHLEAAGQERGGLGPLPARLRDRDRGVHRLELAKARLVNHEYHVYHEDHGIEPILTRYCCRA